MVRTVVVLERGIGETELDLEFRPGVTLTGHVLADGEPEAGARIGLTGVDAGVLRATRSDYAGAFRIEDLEPDRYRLHVRSGDLVHSREIELIADEDVEIELAIGGLHGWVVDAADGLPLGGVEVKIAPADPASAPALAVTRSDTAGVFAFPRLPEGVYPLSIERPGYAALEREVRVLAGMATGELVLALEPPGDANADEKRRRNADRSAPNARHRGGTRRRTLVPW